MPKKQGIYGMLFLFFYKNNEKVGKKKIGKLKIPS